jgi:hypothetical protein
MTRKDRVNCLILLSTCAIAVAALFAQQPQQPAGKAGKKNVYVPEDHRPALFLREDWKHVPPDTPEHPVVQESITTPGIELKLYGETKQHIGPDTGIWEIQRASPKDDPTFIYTGPCMTPCALALRHKDNYMDMTGLAKIRWRTKQTGFHMLRPIVKLADGTWLVGDYAEPASTDWRETEFAITDVRWHLLNIDHVVTTKSDKWVDKPDLSRVDEIGFTDLMPGNVADNGHGTSGASRVDWIEVWANPVSRAAGVPSTK